MLVDGLVLVVDDDPMIRASMTAGLEFWGLRVETAPDGFAALQAIDRETPALILLDLRMPRLDGRGFARELAQREVDIPIILITSETDPREAAMEIGAIAWIKKPVDLGRLFQSIERIIGRAC